MSLHILCLFHPELFCMMKPISQKNIKELIVHCVKYVFLNQYQMNTKIQPQWNSPDQNHLNQDQTRSYNYNHWQLLNHHQQKQLKSMCVRLSKWSEEGAGVMWWRGNADYRQSAEPIITEISTGQTGATKLNTQQQPHRLMWVTWEQDQPVRQI